MLVKQIFLFYIFLKISFRFEPKRTDWQEGDIVNAYIQTNIRKLLLTENYPFWSAAQKAIANTEKFVSVMDLL